MVGEDYDSDSESGVLRFSLLHIALFKVNNYRTGHYLFFTNLRYGKIGCIPVIYCFYQFILIYQFINNVSYKHVVIK